MWLVYLDWNVIGSRRPYMFRRVRACCDGGTGASDTRCAVKRWRCQSGTECVLLLCVPSYLIEVGVRRSLLSAATSVNCLQALWWLLLSCVCRTLYLFTCTACKELEHKHLRTNQDSLVYLDYSEKQFMCWLAVTLNKLLCYIILKSLQCLASSHPPVNFSFPLHYCTAQPNHICGSLSPNGLKDPVNCFIYCIRELLTYKLFKFHISY